VPSERSLFRKIQTVVEVARSVKVSNLEDLCQEIEQRGPTMFNVSRYDDEQDTFVSRISLPAIRRAVVLCEALNLLASDGSLTPQGEMPQGNPIQSGSR